MSLLADFESICMQHHAETNGQSLPAEVWRERLTALEGVYHRMVHSPEWWTVANEKASECAVQMRFTRNQLGLAERGSAMMWHHTPGRFALSASWDAKPAAIIVREGYGWRRTDADGRTWFAGSWTKLMEVRR